MDHLSPAESNHQQGTVARRVNFCGVGLHSGKIVELSVLPADIDSGICFQRTDTQTKFLPIKAHPNNVVDTTLSTTIGSGQGRIATVEHLMAALSGLGIDNALVQLSAEEVPILDGSSAPFVDKLIEIGVQRQPKARKLLVPKRTVEIRQGDQSIRLDPPPIHAYDKGGRPQLLIHYSIDFSNSSAIGKQTRSVAVSSSSFLELCEARTFCHQDDVDQMRQQGLALGGSLDNAVVVNNQKVLNEEGLRYSDEFVRHKILDCIGDLALLGGQITGILKAHKAGHSLHNQLVETLIKEKNLQTWQPEPSDKQTEFTPLEFPQASAGHFSK